MKKSIAIIGEGEFDTPLIGCFHISKQFIYNKGYSVIILTNTKFSNISKTFSS